MARLRHALPHDLGSAWTVREGLVNPVAAPASKDGYLSDPDHLYLPDTKELWLYYREVPSGRPTIENVIYRKRSADGVHWSPALEVARAVGHAIISPSVVRRAPGQWEMWSVNGGPNGCNGTATTVELRTSADGEQWSAPTTVSLAQSGGFPWHIEVQWIPRRRQYWALYNVKSPGTCATGELYLATSSDGRSWRTYPSPVLSKGAIPAFAHIVYRSTFEYDARRDVVTFWYSGAQQLPGAGWVWSAATQQRRRTALFAQIASPRRPSLSTAPASPALVNAP
jgi:hypothetical protein